MIHDLGKEENILGSLSDDGVEIKEKKSRWGWIFGRKKKYNKKTNIINENNEKEKLNIKNEEISSGSPENKKKSIVKKFFGLFTHKRNSIEIN